MIYPRCHFYSFYTKIDLSENFATEPILEYVETTKTLPYEDTSIRDTIKNLTKERDDLRDTLYKVDKNIQYYQKSEQRLEAYQKNQSPKNKARDDDFET